MINVSTKYRSNKAEIMDDFELQGQNLQMVLKDIDKVNNRLGGHRITLKGLKKLCSNSTQKSFTFADIGCGSGDTLRVISDWAKHQDFNLKLYGIDANTHIIDQAKTLSKNHPDIKYLNLNVFSDSFKNHSFDVISCCLTLHHFKDQEILKLLPQLYQQAQRGLLINDLHRSRLAYILFSAYAMVFMKSKIAKHDGAVSILRGFKKIDFIKLFTKINPKSFSIQWCWAFRYLCLIQK